MKLYFPADLISFDAIMIVLVTLLVMFTYKRPFARIARTGAWLLSFVLLGLFFLQPKEYIENSTTDTAGNTYIAAEVRSLLRGRENLYSIKLMKFSPSGRLLWSRRYNLLDGEYALVNAIQTGAKGELYLSVKPEGEQSSLIVKVDPHGRIAWKAESALSAEDLSIQNKELRLLGVDGNGHLAGELYGLEKGTLIRMRSFSRAAESPRQAKWVCSDGGGNIFIFLKNDGSSLAKLGPTGNELWEIPVDSEVYCSVLATDKLGHLYIGGARRSSAYVQKLTPYGKTVWEREFRLESGEESNWVNDIRTGKDGSVYTAGSRTIFTGRTRGVIRYRNSFLAKLSSDGTVEWRCPLKAERYHSSSLGLGEDENGNMLFAGDGPWQHQRISLSKYGQDGRRFWKAVAPPLDYLLLALVLSTVIGHRLLQGNGRRRPKALS